MPVPATNDAFLEMLAKTNLVEQSAIDTALEGQTPFAAPPRLAAHLVKKGVLTKYQAEQLLAGRVGNLYLGKYKILELLGRGGMGAVFLSEHKTMRRRVALKVLSNVKSSDASLVERFHREARAVGALNHPNIVQAYDVDSVGKTHYLVMEYVEGVNLFDLVRKVGPLSIPRAANYIAQAADGLEHAFEAGLVHRDIKPPNLLLSRQGVVKVLDMGLALFFKDDTDHLTAKFDSTTVLGTVDYLAPEQSMDSHGVDIRADIYSLGATLYYLLTGKTPFGDASLAQKLVMLNMREPTPIRQLREEVPEELAAVITKMLAKAPDARYQTPAEVSAALAPWSAQWDVGAEDESLSMSGDSQVVSAPTLGGGSVVPRTNIKRRSKVLPNSDLTPMPDAPSTDNITSPEAAAAAETAPPTITARLMKRFMALPFKTRLIVVGSVLSTVVTGVAFLVLMGWTMHWMSSGPSTPTPPPKQEETPSPTPTPTASIAQVHFPLDGSIDDVSGRGHKLFLNQGASFKKGRAGMALTCDGRTQYAATATPAVDTSKPFTVAAWVNWQGNPGNVSILSQDGNAVSGFFLQKRGDNQHLCLTMVDEDKKDGKTVRADSHEPVLANIWYHVTGIFTGDKVKLYINGRLRDTQTRTARWNASGPLIIGAAFYGATRCDYFKGQIADVRAFAAPLSDGDVMTLYSKTSKLEEGALAPLPAGWASNDLKGPKRPGRALYDPLSDLWTVWGGGADFWGNADQGQFVHTAWQGDGEVVTRLISGPANVDNSKIEDWCKVGIMCRESLSPDSAMTAVLFTGGGTISFQVRPAGKPTADQKTTEKLKAPVWLRLTRKGNKFTGFYAKTADLPKAHEWKPVGEPKDIAMPPACRAGLALSSHTNEKLAWTAFSKTSITPPPPQPK
jgi:serine/threonine protein kinase